MKRSFKIIIRLIIGVILILVIYKVVVGITELIKPDVWQGYYYPDGCLSCSEEYIYSPVFQEKSSCFDWANSLKEKRGNSNDDYECGLNCKPSKDLPGLNLCEETVK